MFPVVGAAIGCVAGGPVGMFVGLKMGAAAAVAGGVTGFASGVYFKRRRDESTDIELDKLSSRKALQEEDKKLLEEVDREAIDNNLIRMVNEW